MELWQKNHQKKTVPSITVNLSYNGFGDQKDSETGGTHIHMQCRVKTKFFTRAIDLVYGRALLRKDEGLRGGSMTATVEKQPKSILISKKLEDWQR